MSQVTVKLIDSNFMRDFYFAENTDSIAITMLAEGKYIDSGSFFLDQTGEDAAEEVFDLTNNPSRQREREEYYGRKRSISVGDIVEVDGNLFLCNEVGWKQLIV